VALKVQQLAAAKRALVRLIECQIDQELERVARKKRKVGASAWPAPCVSRLAGVRLSGPAREQLNASPSA
jgi:hypothetical protein